MLLVLSFVVVDDVDVEYKHSGLVVRPIQTRSRWMTYESHVLFSILNLYSINTYSYILVILVTFQFPWSCRLLERDIFVCVRI